MAFTWEISHVTNVHSPQSHRASTFQDEATLTGAGGSFDVVWEVNRGVDDPTTYSNCSKNDEEVYE